MRAVYAAILRIFLVLEHLLTFQRCCIVTLAQNLYTKSESVYDKGYIGLRWQRICRLLL